MNLGRSQGLRTAISARPIVADMARTWPFVLVVAASAALTPSLALAEVASADFSPSHLQQLVGQDDFTYDSDWFPMDGPVQLRLIVHAGNSVAIDMPGEGLYDWQESALTFEGQSEAGNFGIDVGLTLDAKVRFDVAGLSWESDIIGPYDYAVISETAFTPYLLQGNPDRPATIEDETDPVTLVEVPVTPDILVASGHLDIDIYLIIDGELRGDAIEVATLDPAAQWQAITEEGAPAMLDAGPGPLPDPFVVDGALFCTLMTAPTIVLRPTLVMEILGKEYTIADIDLPVVIPPFDDTIQFETVSMSFPRPPPPPEPETTSTGSDSDSDSGSDSSTESDSSTASGSASDSSTESDSATGGLGGPGEEGCACTLAENSPPSPLWFGLAFIGLGLRRRRVRSFRSFRSFRS